MSISLFFFFQAEDGIRDIGVTGVQTCALPISITRSIIRGSSATLTASKPLVASYNAANAGLVIEDSEIRPEYPSYWQDGVGAQNATLRRVESTGTVDGVAVQGENLHVVDSWIHDLKSYVNAIKHSDGRSHKEGIQVHWD